MPATGSSPSRARSSDALSIVAVAHDAERLGRIQAALADNGHRLTAVADLEAPVAGHDVAVVGHDATPATSSDELRALVARLEDAKLVVISQSYHPFGVRRVLATGAKGLLLDEMVDTALAPTVDAVHAGQVVVPDEARYQLEKPTLTTREKQVLGMVTLGFGNSEIARRLYLAESTIKSHLSSAFSKLGVRSRSEASALILDREGTLGGTGILGISNASEQGDEHVAAQPER